MKRRDYNVDLTRRYLWCQRLAAADSFRDFDSVGAVDSCRHHECCLLAGRLCSTNVSLPGRHIITSIAVSCC